MTFYNSTTAFSLHQTSQNNNNSHYFTRENATFSSFGVTNPISTENTKSSIVSSGCNFTKSTSTIHMNSTSNKRKRPKISMKGFYSDHSNLYTFANGEGSVGEGQRNFQWRRHASSRRDSRGELHSSRMETCTQDRKKRQRPSLHLQLGEEFNAPAPNDYEHYSGSPSSHFQPATPTAHAASPGFSEPLMICSGITIQPRSPVSRTKHNVKIDYPTPPKRRASRGSISSRSGTKSRTSSRRRSRSTASASRRHKENDSENENSSSNDEHSSCTDTASSLSNEEIKKTKTIKKKKCKKRPRSAVKTRPKKDSSKPTLNTPVKYLTPIKKRSNSSAVAAAANRVSSSPRRCPRRELPMSNKKPPKRLLTPIKKDRGSKSCTDTDSEHSDFKPRSRSRSATQRKSCAEETSSLSETSKQKSGARPVSCRPSKQAAQPKKKDRSNTHEGSSSSETSSASESQTATQARTSTPSRRAQKHRKRKSAGPHSISSKKSSASDTPSAAMPDQARSKKRQEYEEEKQRKEILRRHIYAQNRLMRFVAVHEWERVKRMHKLVAEEEKELSLVEENEATGCSASDEESGSMTVSSSKALVMNMCQNHAV